MVVRLWCTIYVQVPGLQEKRKKKDFRPLNHGVLVPLGFRKQQVILGCLGCHVSHAECHVSHAECHVSHAECHVT